MDTDWLSANMDISRRLSSLSFDDGGWYTDPYDDVHVATCCTGGVDSEWLFVGVRTRPDGWKGSALTDKKPGGGATIAAGRCDTCDTRCC